MDRPCRQLPVGWKFQDVNKLAIFINCWFVLLFIKRRNMRSFVLGEILLWVYSLVGEHYLFYGGGEEALCFLSLNKPGFSVGRFLCLVNNWLTSSEC